MATTRPSNGGAATEVRDPGRRRLVARPPGLPGSRAIVGGLLIALAGVGTFVGWQQAAGSPDHAYAVADRALRPGDPITADAVRFVAIDLPDGVAASAFDDPAELEGRVVVGPVGEGELLQIGSLSDQGQGEPAAEVSVTLDRELAVDGRLRTGDLVDVYATHDDDTSVAAEGVRVVSITEAGGSFSDGDQLTVTLAVTDGPRRAPIIHAARAGEITLVRTTHLSRRSSSQGADVGTEPGVAPGGSGPSGPRANEAGPPTSLLPTSPPPAPEASAPEGGG
jgi:Flp pilus assembly protein CpaB